jgi:hypothetical protein
MRLLLLGCLLSAAAAAQSQVLLPELVPSQRLWQRIGAQDGYWHFDRFLLLGHGDGHGDVAQQVDRVTYSPPGFLAHDARVEILSGADGSTLQILAKFGRTGESVIHGLTAAGDMDGDGTPDYAVASHRSNGLPPQLLEVRSGRDAALIQRIESQAGIVWGRSILGDVDLDGDGRRDLAVTYYSHEEGLTTVGRIEAYAHDGRPLYTIRGDPLGGLRYIQTGQRCIAKIGDVDRDGADDFGVGAFGDMRRNAGIAVHSGRTGQLIYYAREPAYPYDAIGWHVYQCPDADADGTPDFVASSISGVGVTTLFSGASGAVIRSWGGGTGRAVAAADLDLDGVGDVITTITGLVVRAFSGRDGQRLAELVTDEPRHQYTFGSWIDVQTARTDAFPRIVLTDEAYGTFAGWQGVGSFDRGRTLLYRSVPLGVEIAGLACARGLPNPPKIGWRQQGDSVRVHLSGAPAGAQAVLLLGRSDTAWGAFRLPLDLAAFGLPGCTLYTSIDAVVTATAGMTGIDRGYAFVDVPLPVAETGSGTVPLHAQWKVVDPSTGGVGFTEMATWHLRL